MKENETRGTYIILSLSMVLDVTNKIVLVIIIFLNISSFFFFFIEWIYK